MFLAYKIFWEQAPKFLHRNYKTEHASNHVAKFHGDQLEFEDSALKKLEIEMNARKSLEGVVCSLRLKPLSSHHSPQS